MDLFIHFNAKLLSGLIIERCHIKTSERKGLFLFAERLSFWESLVIRPKWLMAVVSYLDQPILHLTFPNNQITFSYQFFYTF